MFWGEARLNRLIIKWLEHFLHFTSIIFFKDFKWTPAKFEYWKHFSLYFILISNMKSYICWSQYDFCAVFHWGKSGFYALWRENADGTIFLVYTCIGRNPFNSTTSLRPSSRSLTNELFWQWFLTPLQPTTRCFNLWVCQEKCTFQQNMSVKSCGQFSVIKWLQTA